MVLYIKNRGVCKIKISIISVLIFWDPPAFVKKNTCNPDLDEKDKDRISRKPAGDAGG